MKVMLTNKGRITTVITKVTATRPFAIAGGEDACTGQSVAPKKNCSFDVEFAPVTVANVTGAIDVTYNGTSPAVALDGDSIAVTLTAAEVEIICRGRCRRHRQAGRTSRSRIRTRSLVTLGTATLGAPNPGSFAITSDGCAGQPLPLKGKCIVAVEFAPPGTASGAQSSALSFLGITDIQDNTVNWSSVPGCLIEADQIDQYKLHKGAILIARTGGTKMQSATDTPGRSGPNRLRLIPVAHFSTADFDER